MNRLIMLLLLSFFGLVEASFSINNAVTGGELYLQFYQDDYRRGGQFILPVGINSINPPAGTTFLVVKGRRRLPDSSYRYMQVNITKLPTDNSTITCTSEPLDNTWDKLSCQ